MLRKKLVTLVVAAALATGPVTRAAARSDGIVGGIVGGLVAGALISGATKRTTTTKRVVVRSGGHSVTRAANRETQTALNYFGYPAGTPDGVLGRKSRAAVSLMQAYLGFPVTGQLTQFERDILVGAYRRGVTGSFEAVQLVSKSPDGSKALLIAQKDMMTGGTTTTRRTTGYAGMPMEVSDAIDEIADSSDPSAEQLLQRSGFIQLSDLNGDGNNDYILDTSFSGSSFWCSAVQCKSIVFVSTPNGYARNDLLAFDPTPASFNCIGSSCVVNDDPIMVSTEAAVTPAPNTATTTASSESVVSGLTLFAAPSSTTVSLDSYCSKVSLLTNANGGFTQASGMTDPNMVINEQLCLARAYAIETGERLVDGLGGVTMAQAEAQCAPYGPALKDYVSSLSLKPRADVVREVGGFVLSSGMDPAQLTTTAKICLAAGYRMDNMDIALGSGMLLVVLGETPYGELMGHHLSQGFGASKRVDLALDWYQNALDSLGQGATPVFAPGQIERPMLLQAAVDMLGGGQAESMPIVTSGSKAKLPTFGSPKNFATPKN